MAVPIAVAVNAVRIAATGVAYGLYSIEPSEGIAHLFEGWAVFAFSIFLILATAAALSPGGRMSFDTGLGETRTVLERLRRSGSPAALRAVTGVVVLAAAVLTILPERTADKVERVPFSLLDTHLGPWNLHQRSELAPSTLAALAADDVFSASYVREAVEAAPVQLFMAYYDDQRAGGIHSPEICLPGAGWEIETFSRLTLRDGTGAPFPALQAVIRRDLERRVVLYWFDQHGRRTANDYVAKATLVWDSILHQRTDGALIRLDTPLMTDEQPAEAVDRLADLAERLVAVLPPHLPGAWDVTRPALPLPLTDR